MVRRNEEKKKENIKKVLPDAIIIRDRSPRMKLRA